MDNITIRTVCRFAAVFTAAVLSVCCSKLKKAETGPEEVRVKVEWVNNESGLQNNHYVGTVSPVKSAVLSARYPGNLQRMAVKQGEYVEKGALIAKVASSSLESSYAMAAATLKQAEDGYNRVMQMYKAGSVPEIKKVEVESQLSKARAAAEAARGSLADCEIRAPFAGVIGEVYSSEGVELSVTDPVARILDISEIEIRFPVPEKEISKVNTGDSAFFTVSAFPGKVFNGVIKSKGMVASAAAHSYECAVAPVHPLKDLLPGMVCKVYLTGEMREGIVVAGTVVQMDAGGKYVWTVNKDNIVEKRYITVGGFYGKGVIISHGLQEGDGLIVEGGRKVSTGMKVLCENAKE